jgi:hypothetical protein
MKLCFEISMKSSKQSFVANLETADSADETLQVKPTHSKILKKRFAKNLKKVEN